MEEIKVGEYVRTKQGYIAKCVEVDEDGYYYTFDEFVQESYGDKYDSLYKRELKEIVKHSSNIIDLLEDGDFIVLEYKTPRYKERITRIFEVSIIDNYIGFENCHCSLHCKVGDKRIADNMIKNIKIKQILTKEKFESESYRLEE